MEEFVTDAIVLHIQPHLENNKIADIFTQLFGRVEARVVGGLKINSKLSSHLDPLNLVTLRLVRRNNFVIADALTKDRFNNTRNNTVALGRALTSLFLIRSLLPHLIPEPELWRMLIHTLQHTSLDYTMFLKLLGYNPLLASCGLCNRHPVHSFYVPEQLFVCTRCISKILEKHFLIPLRMSDVLTPQHGT